MHGRVGMYSVGDVRVIESREPMAMSSGGGGLSSGALQVPRSCLWY